MMLNTFYRFLENQLDPTNCIGLINFAEDMGCQTLKQKCEKYICTHFEEVSRAKSRFLFSSCLYLKVAKSEEFRTLTPCRLSQIVAFDEVNVKCESQVYNAVLTWVKYDLKNRHQFFHMLLETVSSFI